MGSKDQTNISRENDNARILQHVLLDWLNGIYKFGPFSGGCRFWRVKQANQLEIELQLRPPYPTAYPLFQNEGAIDGDYVCASGLKGYACERLQRVETSPYAKIMKSFQHPLCGWDFPIDSLLEETTGVFDMGAHWYKYDLLPHCKLIPVSVEDLDYTQPIIISDDQTESQNRPQGASRNNPNRQYEQVDRKAFSIKGRKLNGHILDVEEDTNSQKNSGLSRKQILHKHYQKTHLQQFERIVSIAVLDGEVYDMGLQLKPSKGGCSVEDELDLTHNIIPMMYDMSAKLRKEVQDVNKTQVDGPGYKYTDTAKRSKFIRELGKDKEILKELTEVVNNNLKSNKNSTLTNIDLFSTIPKSNVLTPWLESNKKLWRTTQTVSFNLNPYNSFFPDYHLALYKICRHKNISRYGPYPLPMNLSVLKTGLFFLIPTNFISYYYLLNVTYYCWGYIVPFTPIMLVASGNANERERSMNFRLPRKYTVLQFFAAASFIFHFGHYVFPFEVTSKLLRLKTYSDLVEIPNEDGEYVSETQSNLNTNTNLNDVTQTVQQGYSRYEYLSVVSPPAWILFLPCIQPAYNFWANSWRKHYQQPAHYFDFNEGMNLSYLGGSYLLMANALLGVFLQNEIPSFFPIYVSSSFALIESLVVAKLAREYSRLAYVPNFKLERYYGGEGMERLPDNTIVVPESDVSRYNRIKQNQPGTSGSSDSTTTVKPKATDTSDAMSIEDEALADDARDQANQLRDKFKSISSNQFWYLYFGVSAIHQITELTKLILLLYSAYNSPKNDTRVLQSIALSSFINVFNRTGLPRVVGLAWFPSDSLKWFCLSTPVLKTHDNVKFSSGWFRLIQFGCLLIVRGITYADWSIFDEKNYKYDENGKENNQYDPSKRKFTAWCYNGNCLYTLVAALIAEVVEDLLVHHFMKNAQISSLIATVMGKTYFDVMPIDVDIEVPTGDTDTVDTIYSNRNTRLQSMNLQKYQKSNFNNESAIVTVSHTDSATNSNQTDNSNNDKEQKKLDADAAAHEEKISHSKQLMDLFNPDLLFIKRKHVAIIISVTNSDKGSQTRDANNVKQILSEMPQNYRQQFQNSQEQLRFENFNRQQATNTSSDFIGDSLAKIVRRLVSLTAHGRLCLANDNNTQAGVKLTDTLGFVPSPLLVNCRTFNTQRGGPIGFCLTTHSFFGTWAFMLILPGLILGWDFVLGQNPVYSSETWYRFEQFITFTTLKNPDDPRESNPDLDWESVWKIVLG